MDETTVQTAMAIILHAGDARLACKEALDFVLDDVKHGIDILLGSARECARK